MTMAWNTQKTQKRLMLDVYILERDLKNKRGTQLELRRKSYIIEEENMKS